MRRRAPRRVAPLDVGLAVERPFAGAAPHAHACFRGRGGVLAALEDDVGDVAGRDLHRRQGPERVAEDVAEVRRVGAPREMLRDALAVDLVHNIGLRGSAPLADDRLIRPAVAPALRRLRPRGKAQRRFARCWRPERFADEQQRCRSTLRAQQVASRSRYELWIVVLAVR